MNTPFLKLELRASAAYLVVWLMLSLVLAGLLTIFGSADAAAEVPRSVKRIAAIAGFRIDRQILTLCLIGIAIAVAALILLSRAFQRRRDHERWGPRPNVLCLSCPDDEAITFLGFGEGIANLPQLLLHPGALVLLGIAALSVVRFDWGLIWCGQDLACWGDQVASISLAFVLWVVLALVGGVLGALCIAALFGLSLPLTVETLVSRVLVSYTPLSPAQSHFRGISDIPVKWGNPLQLFHSQIYRSPKTIDEICVWLKQHSDAPNHAQQAVAKTGHAITSPTA